ncbi:ATP12-domain-containing protein [Cylindrobasidium torrendii FP15055 ss-10]|uniref:ATP12-domain-containing protein n=1 Tax=Cylindrobasidium torrendii FP15055 ss-10 TaxID=1314674 RepID=A0A0D7B9W0_9AGAR|nr:ATP12-domain-containing protein [Cylindrobasidium torrendii FP15055 ss-10]
MFLRSTRLFARQSWAVRRIQTAAAEAPADGPAVTQTNRVEATLKRFWSSVDVEARGEKLAVTLDRRALKTPEGNTILLPSHKRLLASLVAAEWDFQTSVIKHHALPVTSLVCRAIDAFNKEETRAEVADALLEYLDTDTICYHQDHPDPIVRMQNEHWLPIIEWARKTYDVKIETTDSILLTAQPKETREKLRAEVLKMNMWELAAMERATYSTKSFLTALALIKEEISVEGASRAARAEVESQIEWWGEVEDTHDVDHQDIRRLLGSSSALCHDI